MTTHTIELVGGPKGGEVIDTGKLMADMIKPLGVKFSSSPLLPGSVVTKYDGYSDTGRKTSEGRRIFEFEEVGG